MNPSHEVYVSAREYAGCGPVLRCVICPEWEVDVDGALLSVAANRAAEHERERVADGAS